MPVYQFQHIPMATMAPRPCLEHTRLAFWLRFFVSLHGRIAGSFRPRRRGGIGIRTGLKIPGPLGIVGSSPTVGTNRAREMQHHMMDGDFFEENCENCRFLQDDDRCGNPESVYHLRPMVYRDGDEVVQTGWCDFWMRRGEA